MKQSHGQANQQSNDDGGHSVWTDAVRRTGHSEIMGDGCTGDHAKGKQSGIRIPLSGEKELSARASAC